MKLLIITQKVDREDSVLGFFHRWIEEFSKHAESVIVICLYKGVYSLPPNVKVLSLGKEELESRIQYVTRFYSYIWKERKNYDSVFVHMNQEYVLLGGFLWRIIGKKIFFWRNHPLGTLLTDIAVLFSRRTFSTSQFSYTTKFKKNSIMPAGIEVDMFKKDSGVVAKVNSLCFVGRISPIKKVECFLQALLLLHEAGVSFKATIVGGHTKQDEEYYEQILRLSKPLLESSLLTFLPSVRHDALPAIYNEHMIFVNLTETGSFDKTILEAMASQSVVITANESFRGVLGDNYLVDNVSAEEVAKKIQHAFSVGDGGEYSKQLRQFVVEKHSLQMLVDNLAGQLSK